MKEKTVIFKNSRRKIEVLVLGDSQPFAAICTLKKANGDLIAYAQPGRVDELFGIYSGVVTLIRRFNSWLKKIQQGGQTWK